MTRLASILGVATVATLVLLSGCEQATQKKDTDYAAALAGTWTYTEDAMVMLGSQPLPVSRTVSVTIMTGDNANTGSVSLMVVDTVKEPANMAPQLADPLSTTVIGTFTVDATKITVTIVEDGITLDQRFSAAPSEATGLTTLLTAMPQVLDYEIEDTELKVSGGALVSLQVTTMEKPQLTLTKSMMS